MQLKLKTSLSGPEYALNRGDVHEFTDTAEALRLVEADFAEPADKAAAAELEAERAVRDAAAKAAAEEAEEAAATAAAEPADKAADAKSTPGAKKKD